MQGLPGGQPVAGQGLNLVRHRPACAACDRLVPPPTSLAMLTATPASSAAGQSKSPLPSEEFDDGLCAICAPASLRVVRSSSSSQMPCANTLRAFSKPARS